MSMDKEELMEHLKTRVERLQAPPDEDPQGYDLTQVMILRAVIALVEIRESIDDLRANIEQVGKSIDDLRIMLFQTRSPWPSRIDDQGKDVRSAGIG